MEEFAPFVFEFLDFLPEFLDGAFEVVGEAIEAEEGLHFRVDEFLTGADFVLLEGRLIARFAGFRRHGWYNRSR